MKQSRATIRYAKSLISISNEQNSLETSFNDMLVLSSVCNSNRDFVNLLKTPIVKTDLKIKILNELLAKAISDLTLSFITLITKKKREILLPEIADCVISLYKKNKNIKEVYVTTATPLDQDLRQEVMTYIKKQTDSKIELKENIDKSLIGGAIIRMDDKQLDASISSSLESLKQQFSENLYIQNY
tara:strand:- start:859 stop:1416 length:558 start_codon:yes stop_codon:yes gene_type:complete